MTSVLHTLGDESTLHVMGAKELCALPIWQGNRIIDNGHVAAIKGSLCGDVKRLDFGYRIVRCPVADAAGKMVTESYIIDGQHRHAVLRDHFACGLCEPDFPVVVVIKDVASELEIIEYFNMLNHAKPITWTDPVLIVNAYIAALQKEFNKVKKSPLIREGATCRPYLSVEKLREGLMKVSGSLRIGKAEIAAFVARVSNWNDEQISQADIACLAVKKADADMIQKCAKAGFMLGRDPRLPWIPACCA